MIAVVGGLIGIAISDRRARNQWLRDARLKAAAELLAGLQLLIRRLINVAYVAEDVTKNRELPLSKEFTEATVTWNNALYTAYLVADPTISPLVTALDQEVDRLIGLAISRVWTRLEFREERVTVGRLAAKYLRGARRSVGFSDTPIRSIWSWDTEAPELGL